MPSFNRNFPCILRRAKAPLVFIALLAWLAASASLPGTARAGNFSLNGSVSAGEESATAYDLGLRYTFDPWIESVVILSPLVEVDGFAWDRSDETVWGASASAGLTMDILTDSWVRPFITGTLGGALITNDRIGDRKLGKHTQIKSRGTVGLRFGETFRHRVYFEVTHYSNAGSNSNNSGFTTYGGGYAFAF